MWKEATLGFKNLLASKPFKITLYHTLGSVWGEPQRWWGGSCMLWLASLLRGGRSAQCNPVLFTLFLF